MKPTDILQLHDYKHQLTTENYIHFYKGTHNVFIAQQDEQLYIIDNSLREYQITELNNLIHRYNNSLHPEDQKNSNDFINFSINEETKKDVLKRRIRGLIKADILPGESPINDCFYGSKSGSFSIPLFQKNEIVNTATLIEKNNQQEFFYLNEQPSIYQEENENDEIISTSHIYTDPTDLYHHRAKERNPTEKCFFLPLRNPYYEHLLLEKQLDDELIKLHYDDEIPLNSLMVLGNFINAKNDESLHFTQQNGDLYIEYKSKQSLTLNQEILFANIHNEKNDKPKISYKTIAAKDSKSIIIVTENLVANINFFINIFYIFFKIDNHLILERFEIENYKETYIQQVKKVSRNSDKDTIEAQKTSISNQANTIEKEETTITQSTKNSVF